jgi:beta-lactamase class A
MKTIFTTILIFVFLTLSCAAQKTDTTNNPANNNANRSKTAVKIDAELQRQIEQIASEAKGKVGVRAEILETGERVSLNADGRFPMQSVYKLPIGMATLRLVEEGKLKLDQRLKIEKSDLALAGQYSPLRDKFPNGTELTIEELVEYTVSVSDNTASDILLRLVGADGVMRYLSDLGVRNIIVADSEREMSKSWETQYRNYATPEAAVELLRALQEKRDKLSEANRARIIKYMIETTRGVKRLKGLLPPEAVVAHRPGTSNTRNGIAAATNDIGIITLPDGRNVLIAVFVSDSPADNQTREAVIAKIAKAVWDKWGKQKS